MCAGVTCSLANFFFQLRLLDSSDVDMPAIDVESRLLAARKGETDLDGEKQTFKQIPAHFFQGILYARFGFLQT